ncbi:MAG: PP2C family protein-serine/threonine phosphatase, partial [Coriobacteriia bacterium]|nr:PP2C family protein-serine/threonine phosphatase [Coriobacteriia bacterium]
RFVTLIYGLLDARTGEVRLVCAGHPAPLICDASGCAEDVSIHNPPLGVFDLMEFEEFRTVLRPGMRLVAFSDGLLDARHGKEFLGEQRVRELVDAMGDASPDALAADLLAAAQHHSEGHPPDDIAILALRYTGL